MFLLFAFIIPFGPFIWFELKSNCALAFSVNDGYHLVAPIDNVTSRGRTSTQVIILPMRMIVPLKILQVDSAELGILLEEAKEIFPFFNQRVTLKLPS